MTAPGREADPRTWFGPEDRPWVERGDWASAPKLRAAMPTQREQAEQYHRDGYVVLPGAIDAGLAAEATAAVAPHLGTTGPDRLTNAAWALPSARQVAVAPAVIDVIGFLYGRRPVPFQTLHFGRGTEQAAHRDSLHFDSLPPRFMCGAWVALEDVDDRQGPVSYWPGSHRRVDAAADGGCHASHEEVRFTARTGDVLIWSADLLHGGSPIEAAGSTRWSQVTHYVFDGCAYYTPMHSDPAAGLLAVRRPLVDLGTGRVQPHRLGTERARYVVAADGRSRLLAPGEPDPTRWRRVRSWLRHLPAEARGRTAPRLARLTHRPPRA